MLIDQNGKTLEQVWHKDDFDSWTQQLRAYSLQLTGNSDQYYDAAYEALLEKAESSEGWLMSSHIPGKDWTGTPYDPLWLCLGTAHDHEQWDCARKFFGLLLCQVLIDRKDEWEALPKAEKDDGTLYRRCN